MEIENYIYEVKENEKIIKIFNQVFVKNNKYKYKIIYNNKLYHYKVNLKFPTLKLRNYK